MNIPEFQNSLMSIFPLSIFDSNESGDCTWIRILVNDRTFAIQVTSSEGIGVSKVDLSQTFDFFGHDAVFQDLEQVIEFIKEQSMQ